MSTRKTWLRAVASTAIATASCFAFNAQAEETITTGDGMLSLTANMPAEVRAGEEFSYMVKVTNASDNVTLHNITLKQLDALGFSVTSASLGSAKSATAKDIDSTNASQEKAKDESQNKGDAKGQDKDKDKDKDKNKSRELEKGEISIPILKPGESQTITVKATADEEGELRSCLAITSYMPAICLTSQVIKPELELTKVAPEKADRCNVIELKYTAKNGGTGDVGPFLITDTLTDGMATIEGKSELKFEVDGLKSGESRSFVARVYATKPGTFTSRATAKAVNSELSSRSKETTTEVIAADLDVQVDAPSRLYGKQLAKFTARVTNTGNSPADNVQVNIFWPEANEFVDRSEPKLEQASQASTDSQSKDEKDQGQPTPAQKPNQADAQANDKAGDNAGPAMSDKSFIIKRLEAGQTAIFEYAVRTSKADSLPTKVVARYVCELATAGDEANAKNEIVSTGMASVEVVNLPAMQIVVVDDEDPVATNSNVVYSVRVWNEGEAKDNQVTLRVELPEGLEFVSANGPTENSVEGSTVTFKPIETLEAGDRADFKITTKATGDGDVRFKAMLKVSLLKRM